MWSRERSHRAMLWMVQGDQLIMELRWWACHYHDLRHRAAHDRQCRWPVISFAGAERLDPAMLWTM